MKTSVTIAIGAIAVAIFAVASLLLTGFEQAANAVSDNANMVAKIVNKNGFSSNQGYMQSCKQFQSAQSCATDPISGNGPFTSGLAHEFNGPK